MKHPMTNLSREDGFTTGEPWLPYGDLSVSVERQASEPASLLSLYRKLIWFRRSSDALRFGDYAPVDGLPPGIFAYTRTHGEGRTLTVLNFTNDEIAFDLPGALVIASRIAGTHPEAPPSQHLSLAGNEGRLLRLG